MITFSPEILLIFPPGWSTSSPYLSVPLLSAFLTDNGIPNEGIDLNIRIHNDVLTDRNLDSSAKVINELLSRSDIDEKRRTELLIASDLYGIIKGTVDDTVSRLRNESVCAAEMIRINRFIETAYRIHSAPYFPGRIHEGTLVYTKGVIYSSFLDYNNFEIVHTLTDLEIRVENNDTNPFYPHLEKFVSELDLSGVKMVGLSVCGYSQLISSLVLAHMLKIHAPGLKITMGGAIMPYILTALEENPYIFKYIDFIISGPGEDALIKLYDHICGRNIGLGKIGGLLYYDPFISVVKNGEAEIVCIDRLPAPCFNSEELDYYLVSKKDIALPVLGSRGCYWSKCAFCGINCNYDGKYQMKQPELLIGDMEYLENRHNINHFRLIDNCIHPNTLKKISRIILDRGNKFLWQCMVRFEEGFTAEIWKQLYDSGLRLASFGLESPNQSILDRMNKGVYAGRITGILNQCHQARIFTHCFFIVGFPGEQNIHPDELIDFIRNNRYHIDSLTITAYRLEGQSYVFGNQEEFDIELAKIYPKDYIMPNYEHKDFCHAAERLFYINNSIADLDCSGICFSGVDDMFIIGNIFRGLRPELGLWQKSRMEAYKKLLNIVAGESPPNIELLRIESINPDRRYALFHNDLFFNYYLFENQKDDTCSSPINKYFNYADVRHIEYLFDILSGITWKYRNNY